jgi:hypothetical protein
MGREKGTFKIFILILLLPIILLCCINVEQKIKIKSDGSGIATITYIIPEKLYHNPVSLRKLKEYIPVEEEDLVKIYSTRDGVRIEGTKLKKTEKSREISIKLAFEKIESLSTDRIFYSLKSTGDENHLTITVTKKDEKMNEIKKGIDMNKPMDEHDITQLLGELLQRFHLKVELILPSPPITVSGGKKIDDRTVSWDVPFSTFYKEDIKELSLEVSYSKQVSFWQRLKEKIGF